MKKYSRNYCVGDVVGIKDSSVSLMPPDAYVVVRVFSDSTCLIDCPRCSGRVRFCELKYHFHDKVAARFWNHANKGV